MLWQRSRDRTSVPVGAWRLQAAALLFVGTLLTPQSVTHLLASRTRLHPLCSCGFTCKFPLPPPVGTILNLG